MSHKQKNTTDTPAKRVFIIDDDTVYCEMLKEYLLRLYPYEILLYADGNSALRDLKKKTPDLIILDYYLDGTSGYGDNGLDVLRSIMKKQPDAKVVMLSRAAEMDLSTKAYDYGAIDYVIKNINEFSRLEKIIQQHLK